MLEIELTRRNIPFVKFGGLKFTEAAHVKDMLAVLRWAENPTDRVTGFRVVQLLPGLGPATAAKVLDAMAGRSAIDALATFRPPAKAVDAWRDLVELMQRSARRRPPAGRRSSIWCGSGISPISSSATRMRVVRAGDLEQLVRIAAGYPSREAFLTDLTLDPPGASQRRKPARRCSTRTI